MITQQQGCHAQESYVPLQDSQLIATLNRVADALERNTESNAALFGLLMSAEPEREPETSVIPHTLDD